MGLQRSLMMEGVDYEAVIRGFGQVRASEERAKGRTFTLREHVRGLILAQLSNQRPWKPIADKLDQIAAVFADYDPAKLADADPDDLTSGLRRLHCGNRADKHQMASLASNVATFKRIEAKCGSMDAFVSSDRPDRIARVLSEPGPYKLHYVGPALACEYLKNVGFRASKPDVHVRRILSRERLSYANGHPSEWEAYAIIETLANQAGRNPAYLDNLLWMFCATDYGAICAAAPQCRRCSLSEFCEFPHRAGST
jgi:endonuclease III